jgi:hypothetical protein
MDEKQRRRGWDISMVSGSGRCGACTFSTYWVESMDLLSAFSPPTLQENREWNAMETRELLKAWKRFGRPPALVDANVKRAWRMSHEDVFEEGMGLLSG